MRARSAPAAAPEPRPESPSSTASVAFRRALPAGPRRPPRDRALRRRRGAARCARELGVSARRSRRCSSAAASPSPAAARAFLAADEAHDPRRSRASTRPSALVLRHVARRRADHGPRRLRRRRRRARPRSSSARCARSAPTSAGSSRAAPRTATACPRARSSASPRAARGCSSPSTAAITAVDEVAARARAGMDVVVTDHHRPAPTARCPTRRSSIRRSAATRAPTCAPRASPTSSRGAARRGRARPAERRRRPRPRRPRHRRRLRAAARARTGALVRAGLRALAHARAAGPARADAGGAARPRALDARTIGFRARAADQRRGPPVPRRRRRRAPAHRGRRARAARSPRELDRANAERRHVEQRILFEAEAQVAERGRARRRYVLAGEGWHPGVIGIVASRIAERHHRPVRARSRSTATRAPARAARSRRSTCSAGWSACAEHLPRHGGHRAAAGLRDRRARTSRRSARRSRRTPPPCSRPEDLVPVAARRRGRRRRRAGHRAGRGARARSRRSAWATPTSRCSCPPRGCRDPRPMGEGKHVRFTRAVGRRRAPAPSPSARRACRLRRASPVDAVVRAGAQRVARRRRAAARPARRRPCAPAPIEVARRAGRFAARRSRSSTPRDRGRPAAPRREGRRPPRRVRDRRERGIAGMVGALVASGEPVLRRRAPTRRAARAALARDRSAASRCARTPRCEPIPACADGAHVVALDPPPTPAAAVACSAGEAGRTVHLAWGRAELRVALRLHEREHGAPCDALARSTGPCRRVGRRLRGRGARPGARCARRCARAASATSRERRPWSRAGSRRAGWSSGLRASVDAGRRRRDRRVPTAQQHAAGASRRWLTDPTQADWTGRRR